MRVLIEIPNKDIPKYQEIIDVPLHFIDGKVCEAGGYGFVELPKGHGDLIDVNNLKHAFILWRRAVQGFFTDADIESVIYNSPIIVEAESEE